MTDAALAALLVASSVLKIAEFLGGYGRILASPSISKSLSVTIIICQLLMVAWLIFGSRDRLRFKVTLLLFLFYLVVVGYKAAMFEPSCGCFGNIVIAPIWMLVADSVAIISLLGTNQFSGNGRVRAAFGILAAGCAFTVLGIVGYRSVIGMVASPSTVFLDPNTWVGAPFPSFDHVDTAPIRNGRWIVVFFHGNCDVCLRAVPAYIAFSKECNPDIKVAFIDMDNNGSSDVVPVGTSYLRLRLSPDHTWIATTPIVVAMEDGQVLTIVQGEDALPPIMPKTWQISTVQKKRGI